MIRTIVTPSGVVLRARVVEIPTPSELYEQHMGSRSERLPALEKAVSADELDAQPDDVRR